MPNPVKGEVAFEVEGATYTLSYSIDSLCVLEELLDLDVDEIGRQMLTKPRLGFLRAVLWAGLRDHHPGLDARVVGEMIPVIGGERVGQMIGSAFFKAFPTAEAKDPKGPPKPPVKTPAAGTGKSSTASGASSRSGRRKPIGG